MTPNITHATSPPDYKNIDMIAKQILDEEEELDQLEDQLEEHLENLRENSDMFANQILDEEEEEELDQLEEHLESLGESSYMFANHILDEEEEEELDQLEEQLEEEELDQLEEQLEEEELNQLEAIWERLEARHKAETEFVKSEGEEGSTAASSKETVDKEVKAANHRLGNLVKEVNHRLGNLEKLETKLKAEVEAVDDDKERMIKEKKSDILEQRRLRYVARTLNDWDSNGFTYGCGTLPGNHDGKALVRKIISEFGEGTNTVLPTNAYLLDEHHQSWDTISVKAFLCKIVDLIHGLTDVKPRLTKVDSNWTIQYS
jgi:hypothetical protein